MGEVRFSTESYDGCEKELISFRNANRGLARDLGYFRWRYLKRPNKAEPVIVWATDASGERVGALSVIPHHYHVGGSVERLGILGDISVSKKCRGRGIAKGMFEYLSGLKEVKDLSACVVLPNAEALKPLEKSGWVSVTRLERYVKLLSTREMIEKRLNKKMISRLISPTLDFLLKVASGEALVRSRSEYTGSTVGGFDARFDELWETVNKDGMALGLRNREYLAWRYSSHPVEKYGVYTLSRGPKLCGYVVFHTDGNACNIDDLLCLGEDAIPAYLLSDFIGHVRKNRLSSKIIINVNDSNLTGVSLGRFGFFKSSDHLDFMVLRTDGSSRVLSEGKNWFITAGDKDV